MTSQNNHQAPAFSPIKFLTTFDDIIQLQIGMSPQSINIITTILMRSIVLILHSIAIFIKCSNFQLAANADDLTQAFVALDSSDLICGIYSGAIDLLRIPSLSVEPVSVKVETNTLALNDLVTKVDCLEAKTASPVRVCSKASSYSS